MNFTKIVLDELYRCYSTMAMELDGQAHYFYASEEKDYPCYAYHAETYERKVVWEKGGGVMSMIPHPKELNTFLAIKDFYLKETPSQSKLVKIHYDGSRFIQTELLCLPFLHRFDVFELDEQIWILASTIAHDKKDKEDWSQAGKVYVGVLKGNTVSLEPIQDGLYRNHGYARLSSGNGGTVTADQGIFKIFYEDHQWKVNQLSSKAVGEVAIIDLDHDGQDEWLTIEPFHGNEIHLYSSLNPNQTLWSYPHEIDFAHSLLAVNLTTGPSIFGGIRRIHPDLFRVYMKDKTIHWEVIDDQAGPANVAYTRYKNQDIILSANHTSNQAALYVLK